MTPSKYFLSTLFCFISIIFLGQSGQFAKFKNEISENDAQLIIDRINEKYHMDFLCPFTINSKKLKLTYVFEGNRDTIDNIISQIDPYLEYAEDIPDYEFFYTPNDFNASTQWNLNKINAPQAWDISIGNAATIALVDDAVEVNHSDLNSNIWINPNEIAGNGIDDDGNGYIDDVNGWDVANSDNDPSPPTNATGSYFSHGTHCAGIASAITDNNNGISSIGFNTKIIPVKIADDATSMLTAAYSGVDYAISVNADVISMSWGGGAYSITYQNIFDFAHTQGIVCVAAAGNNNSSIPMYPASYNHVISVGATDSGDFKASYSNYGSSIDVMAPGSSIYSTVPNNGYGYKSGTSMACPLVSGLVALMISHNTVLTPDEIELCIKNTCDNIDSQNSAYVGQIGGGRINAYAALQCIEPISADFESDAIFSCVNGQIQFTDLSNNNPTSWEWTFPGGTPSTSSVQNPLITYSTPGTYDVELIVHNADGSDTLLMSNYITVDIPSAQISGNATIAQGSSGILNFSFSGNPPFGYVYTDGMNNYSVSGVINYSDQQLVSPSATTTYSLVSMTDSDCSGNISGSATMNVINIGSCISYSVPTFRRELETSYDDEARAIYSTSDGGAIILGASDSGFGQRDYSLFKLDTNYNLQWTRSIGTSGDEGFTFCDITEDGLGNYLIIGATKYSSSRRECELIKVDPSGNIIFTAPLQEINTDIFNDVIVRSNGNYLVVGTTNNIIGNSDYFIVEYSPTGSLIQSKALGNTSNDHIFQIFELPNGNFNIIGSTESGPGARAGLITELDANLNILSNNSFSSGNNRQWFTSALFKPNGNFLILGRVKYPSERVLITEISSTGTVLWTKDFSVNGTLEPTGIIALDNGTYAISWLVKKSSSQEFFLAAIDDYGSVIWSKKIPLSSSLLANHTDNLISNANDGGILTIANGKNASSLKDNINLFKFDLCGNLYCSEVDFPISMNSQTTTVTNITFYTGSAGTLISTPHSEQNTTVTDNIICSVNPTAGNCNVLTDFLITQSSCINDSILFEDNSFDTIGNSNIVYWHWNLGDGNVLSGDSIVSHLYASPGTYNVELIVGNDFQCYDTIVQTINISNTIGISLTDTIICLNDSIQLLPEVSCLTNSYTASWSPATGLNNDQILNPIASPTVTTTYTLTLTDQFGSIFSHDVTVVVDSSCCVSYANFTVNNSHCLNDSIQIINTSQSSSVATYEWDFGIASSPSSYSGSNPPLISYSSPGAFIIELILSDNCGTDTLYKSIYINDLPEALVANDTTTCPADTIYLGTEAVGNLLYHWTPSLMVSDSSSSDPYTIVESSTSYSLTVTDPFTGCSNSREITVSRDICLCELTPNFLFDPEICQYDTLEAIDISTYEYGYIDYRQWIFGDGNILNIDSIAYHHYLDSGTYEIELIIGLDSSCLQSISGILTVFDLPNPSIISDTLICIGDTLYLGGIADSNLIYEWSPPGLAFESNTANPYTIGESNSSFTLFTEDTVTGCYNQSVVEITAKDCSCRFVIPNVFTPNQDGDNDFFTVKEIFYCHISSIQIYNRWGQLLFSGNESLNAWDGRTADGQLAPEGTYYYIVVIDGTSYSGPFELFR